MGFVEFLQVALIVAILGGVVYALLGVHIVREGEVMLLERLGKYVATLGPGLHFINPVLESPKSIAWTCYVDDPRTGKVKEHVERTSRLSTQERILDLPKLKAISKDKIEVEIDPIVFYVLLDAKKAAYAVQDLHAAIEALTITAIRESAAILLFEELLAAKTRLPNSPQLRSNSGEEIGAAA